MSNILTILKQTIDHYERYNVRNVPLNPRSRELDDVLWSWSLFDTTVPVRINSIAAHELDRKVRLGVVADISLRMVII